MLYRKINSDELSSALQFSESVFMQFEAPEYTKRGVLEFRNSLKDSEYINNLIAYGAFSDDEIVGIIATRNGGSHIALFFVKAEYQKLGIGGRLFNMVTDNMPGNKLTVNSSPYAVPVYIHLGFTPTDCECVVSGIIFTPMIYIKGAKQVGGFTDQLNLLCDKNANTGRNAMEILKEESHLSDKLYSYIEVYLKMLESGNSYVRNRALGLIAANAKWDSDNKIDFNLSAILRHITDDKPITARECIKAVGEIIKAKPYLFSKVKSVLKAADTSKYAGSMRLLIDKDIMDLLNNTKRE